MGTYADDSALFDRYPRAVAHMRSQLSKVRFGVILGSGVGKPLGYPDWAELIERIADHPQVQGAQLLRDVGSKPLPIQAQILFGHFCDRNRKIKDVEGLSESDAFRILRSKWRDLVHDALYQGVSTNTPGDSVYGQFADVISRSAMTINYNFDDTLERLLLDRRSKNEREQNRGYETVVDARLQFRQDRAIIYHPNGFLPRNRFENPSDRIVLTEDSFGDQLIDTMSGQYAALVNHLSKNTCLFVGLSLDDQTLRHILRQQARMNPGHVHYYVAFVKGARPDDRTCDAERDANFDVFNLVTLFLDQAELASLGRLLVADDATVTSFKQPKSYTFYLSGAPGSGKTTTASYLRNLITYDEWLDARPAALAKPHDQLTDDELKEVDQWIVAQIGLKNNRVAYDCSHEPVGIRVVDRCLADPIVFSADDQWKTKATAIKASIAEYNRGAQPGHVVVLICAPRELVVRVKAQNKESRIEYSTKLQLAMTTLYPSGPGITHLDVSGDGIQDVAKRVARLIHLDRYTECNLDTLLTRVESGEIAPPGPSNA